MAQLNRTELTALFDAWTASLDLEVDHKPALKQLVESISVSKPVPGADSFTTATKTIDFTGYDYILASTTASITSGTTITVSITGINDGEIKILKIYNNHDAITEFTGVVDNTTFLSQVNDAVDQLYIIKNIAGVVYIKSEINDLSVASNTGAFNGSSSTSLIVPSNLKYAVRSGHKVLSNAETYTVADGVGSIQIPSGVTGGSVTLTDAMAATSEGQAVEIYSTGGSGVLIYLEGDNDTSVTTNKTLRYRSDGSNWYRVSNF